MFQIFGIVSLQYVAFHVMCYHFLSAFFYSTYSCKKCYNIDLAFVNIFKHPDLSHKIQASHVYLLFEIILAGPIYQGISVWKNHKSTGAACVSLLEPL